MKGLIVKRYIIFLLFAFFFTWNISALPVSSSSILFDAQISADMYTKSEVTTPSLWYGSIMPGYRLNFTFNYLNPLNKFHQFGLGFKYFESNSFTANSLELDQGEMRALIFNLNGYYTRYLHIFSHFYYVTGINLNGVYNYYGKVLNSNESRSSEMYYLKVAPVNGFSLSFSDIVEIKSLLFLNAGIPISGKVSYPGDISEDISPITVGLSINTEISFYIKRLYLSVSYEWLNDFIISLEDNSDYFMPQTLYSESLHSFSFKAGFKI